MTLTIQTTDSVDSPDFQRRHTEAQRRASKVLAENAVLPYVVVAGKRCTIPRITGYTVVGARLSGGKPSWLVTRDSDGCYMTADHTGQVDGHPLMGGTASALKLEYEAIRLE